MSSTQWVGVDEVSAFLRASKLPTTSFHRTTEAGARGFIEHGVDMSRNVNTNSFDLRGLYTWGERPTHRQGFAVEIAIDSRNPFSGTPNQLRSKLHALVGASDHYYSDRLNPVVRNSLMVRDGWDAVEVLGESGRYVIGLREGNIALVRPVGIADARASVVEVLRRWS